MSRKWEKVEGRYVTGAYICAQTTELWAICYPDCHMSSEVRMNRGVKAGSSLSIQVPSLGSLEIHFTLNDFCLFMFVSMREM